MKKNVLMLGALALTAVMTLNCKKGAGELTAAAGEYLTILENAATTMEKAADGKEAAAAMLAAHAATTPMEKKFPQLKDIDKAPELASVMPRYTAVKTRMETVMTKFLTSPEFVEAMQKISTVEK